ncbi:MAG: glycosyltransferase family 2 protein [Verrucomicrobia bacterium]|nr:glycosyltransferase family 2 protein [Verrucomicrobiota bacterium]
MKEPGTPTLQAERYESIRKVLWAIPSFGRRFSKEKPRPYHRPDIDLGFSLENRSPEFSGLPQITLRIDSMKKQDGRVCIILLNWNGKKDTLECLESLEKVTYSRFQTIVVDNGSTDDSVDSIRAAYPNIPLFETKANLGFAGGNNVGIEWALSKPFEWILLLNNDTTVAPDFLDRFLEAAAEKKAKVLGAKIYRYQDRRRIDHFGGYWNPKIAEFESHGADEIDDGIGYEDMRQVDYVTGCALLMHKSVPEKIGLLEPRFFLYWEETDYCYRARRAGFEIWIAPQAHVYHKVSSSFTGGKPHMQYFWWRSRLLWIARNCTPDEKKALYKRVVLPELAKFLRHYLLKSAQNGLLALLGRSDPARSQKVRRYKAGLAGALHYFLGRFGNCPDWVIRKK